MYFSTLKVSEVANGHHTFPELVEFFSTRVAARRNYVIWIKNGFELMDEIVVNRTVFER